MSSATKRLRAGSMRGLTSAALAGSIIMTSDIYAGEADGPEADTFAEAGMVRLPAWEPMFENPPPPAPSESAVAAEGSIPQLQEEVVLAPPETLDEAIRVASLQTSDARSAALMALWRRYDRDVLLRTLTWRIDNGTLEAATLAAEVFLAGGSRGREAALELLASVSPRTGDRMAYALSSQGDRALLLFARALERPSPSVQLRGAWGLGRIGGAESAKLLGKVSSHPDIQLRLVAVEGLGSIPVADRAGQLARFASDPVPAVRRRVAELYSVAPAPEAKEVLERLATDADSSVRTAVVVALAAQGKEGIAALEGALQDPLSPLRAEAGRGLATALSDQDRVVLLRNPDAVVRQAVLEALVGRPDVHVSVFRAVAEDPDPSMRSKALERIVTSSGAEAVASAMPFMVDPEWGLQMKAADFVLQGIDKVDPEGFAPVAKRGALATQRKVVAALVSSRSPEALQALRHFVDVSDAKLRAMVIARLAERPSEEALASLKMLVHDEDPAVRRTVLVALAAMPYDGVLEPLMAFLDDPVPQLRQEAARFLGARRDPRTVLALSAHAKDSNLEVREAVLAALQLIRDDAAAGAIARFLHDPDPAVRKRALESLAKIGTPMALGFIGEVFSHDDEALRRGAIAALRQAAWEQPDVAAEELAHFLHDPVPDVQGEAIAAAGATGHGNAIEGLVALAAEQEARVRRQAVSALQRVRDNEAVAGLEQFVADPDAQVRQGAYRGFAKVGGRQGFARLVAGLEDRDPGVRAVVIESVAELRLGMAVPGLSQRLAKADLPEQKAIIAALGQIPTTEAKAALLELSVSGGVWQKLFAEAALNARPMVEQEAEMADRMLSARRQGT